VRFLRFQSCIKGSIVLQRSVAIRHTNDEGKSKPDNNECFDRNCSKVKQNLSGIRVHPGIAFKNSITGDVLYTPPCCEEEIRTKMASLEKFINIPGLSPFDPIIKLSLIHYQF
jgi:hypothetical protein